VDSVWKIIPLLDDIRKVFLLVPQMQLVALSLSLLQRDTCNWINKDVSLYERSLMLFGETKSTVLQRRNLETTFHRDPFNPPRLFSRNGKRG
jgi:hypothetical protein